MARVGQRRESRNRGERWCHSRAEGRGMKSGNSEGKERERRKEKEVNFVFTGACRSLSGSLRTETEPRCTLSTTCTSNYRRSSSLPSPEPPPPSFALDRRAMLRTNPLHTGWCASPRASPQEAEPQFPSSGRESPVPRPGRGDPSTSSAPHRSCPPGSPLRARRAEARL